jgi:hypothetical protein
MTEQSPSPIGTVAQEAARLIEDMATMARYSYSRSSDPSRYAGEPAQEPYSPNTQDKPVQEPVWPSAQGEAPVQDPVSPNGQDAEAPAQDRQAQDRDAQDRQAQDRQAQGSGAGDKPSGGACSQCGAEREDRPGDGIPSNCKLCPLCRGIGLLRSVKPETVDLLADLAMSVAAGLREVAMWSRASDPASAAKSTPGGPTDPDRAPVQDIPVDDDSEG